MKLADSEMAERRAKILELIASLEVVDIDAFVLERAAQPMPTELGTLDAIHLATALLWKDMTPAFTSTPHTLRSRVPLDLILVAVVAEFDRRIGPAGLRHELLNDGRLQDLAEAGTLSVPGVRAETDRGGSHAAVDDMHLRSSRERPCRAASYGFSATLQQSRVTSSEHVRAIEQACVRRSDRNLRISFQS